MQVSIGLRIAVAAALFFGAMSAAADSKRGHGGATGVVKERMELMERFDELTDRVFAMLCGEIPYDAATVRKAAMEIEHASGAKLTALFPKGGGGKPSEARPQIWQDVVRFRHFADRLGGIAAELADWARTPGAGKNLPRKWKSVTMGGGMMDGGMMGGGSDTTAAASVPPRRHVQRLSRAVPEREVSD